MKSLTPVRLIIAIMFVLMFFGASLQAGTIIIKKRPPVVKIEVRGKAPYRNAVWINGHWRWHNNRHVWVKGYWQKPRHGFVWVDGHWGKRRNGWVWIPGHWKRV